MKTLEEVLSDFKTGAIDKRDAYRIAMYVPEDQLHKIGFELNNKSDKKHIVIKWSKDNILKQLKADVEFGFEKALSMRGISSSLMYEVVLMWNRILEDGLEDWDSNDYQMYGLPLFKATALKYGWDNPIGDDSGTEDFYNEAIPCFDVL